MLLKENTHDSILSFETTRDILLKINNSLKKSFLIPYFTIILLFVYILKGSHQETYIYDLLFFQIT